MPDRRGDGPWQEGDRHRWADPDGLVRWPHCAVCGVIRRRDGGSDGKSCGGPVRIGLRDGSGTVSAWTCPTCGEEFVVVPDQAATHERLCDGPGPARALSLVVVPISYEPDGRREGPCECGVRLCGEDTDCPDCSAKDIYEPCPLQGFGCGWMGGGCADGCCEPGQVALVERLHVESARRTNERWPGTFPAVPRLVAGTS